MSCLCDNSDNSDDSINNLLVKGIMIKDKDMQNRMYEKYDRLIWDISSKWYITLKNASKGNLELEDIHNELWIYIYNKIHLFNEEKGAKLSSWIYMVSQSKCGMMKRSLETKKNNIKINEINYSLNESIQSDENNKFNILNIIGNDFDMDHDIIFKEKILDFIYIILELIDSCTDKERKIYLYKIQGDNLDQISQKSNACKSYVPKVFKRLTGKFKSLYDTLDSSYISKEERDSISKDLLSNKSIQTISEEYDLEIETIAIVVQILKIAGFKK